MKLQSIDLHPHSFSLSLLAPRKGALLEIRDEQNKSYFAEVAPLPNWSRETLEECFQQFVTLRAALLEMDWTKETCLCSLAQFSLLPSLSFGLESALLSLLSPLPSYEVSSSALLLGSVSQILEQADLREKEGYRLAKLKVGHLPFTEAAFLIDRLKNRFRLRIDVNRAWQTADSLSFFSQFALDAFDYVEEPFQNPRDLSHFPHPLAVDESFPQDLSLKDLATFPTLKALIYKPTIQGGLLHCLPLHQWTQQNQLSLILSSSFETDLGLAYIASLAKRLSLDAPLGIGTYSFLQKSMCPHSLQWAGPRLKITERFAGENQLISSECSPI